MPPKAPESADTRLTLTDRLRYGATNIVLRALFGTMLALPYARRVPAMGWAAAHLIAPAAGWRRRIRKNLFHVMPDMPTKDVERLVREVPDNVGRTLIEIYSGAEFAKRAAEAPITGPGLAALDAARAEGRPAILVTAHFGNYDAARAALIARGHDMGALYRAAANPYFNDHYVRAISAIGTPMFEQGRRGMMQLVRHLRGGGVLGILTDLYASDGPRIPFFGKPARTSLITAEMALKYDCVLIPTFTTRQPDGLSFAIEMQEPIPHTDARAMTEEINTRLEALVRRNMGQWFWIHRRWKKAG